MLALAWSVVGLPAQAVGDGVTCDGWDSSTGISGIHQNPCVDVQILYNRFRGRGKAYYTGSLNLDAYDVVAQLQKQLSVDGSWSTIESNICDYTDIANSTPGNICNTPFHTPGEGTLYRVRVRVTIFIHGAGTDTDTYTILNSFTCCS